ncbi:PHP domain-containing protein [Bacteroidota bacterium]
MEKPQTADMHMHSVYSDGVLTLDELFAKAKLAGLSAISITDHDTIDGCNECYELKNKYGIDYLTGIEFSCFEETREFHLLGYHFDPDYAPLKKHLKEFRQARYVRAEKILQKLVKLGRPVEMDLVLELAGKAPIIRPHIAQAMFRNGHVKSVKEAFQKYLGDWKPAYAPKKIFPVENAIKLVNNSGGVASLAHPGSFLSQDALYRMIQSGLDGIEVIHPMHDESLRNFYHSVASQYWLLETGGSDYHGNKEYDEVNFGKLVVPYSIFESIRYHSG